MVTFLNDIRKSFISIGPVGIGNLNIWLLTSVTDFQVTNIVAADICADIFSRSSKYLWRIYIQWHITAFHFRPIVNFLPSYWLADPSWINTFLLSATSRWVYGGHFLETVHTSSWNRISTVKFQVDVGVLRVHLLADRPSFALQSINEWFLRCRTEMNTLIG